MGPRTIFFLKKNVTFFARFENFGKHICRGSSFFSHYLESDR